MQKPLQSGTDCGEEPQPWPLTAWACIHFGWVQIVISAMVWCFCGGAGPILSDPPLEEIEIFYTVKWMLIPAFLLELSYLLSSRNRLAAGLQRASLETSCLLLVEFTAKITCYTIMSLFAGGIVHVNLRASGPVRGCYTVRFIEWSIAVPTLVIISDYPLNHARTFRGIVRRLCPNVFATMAYVLTSWVGLVSPNAVAGWSLVALAFTAYVVCLADQIAIIREADPNLEGLRFKSNIIMFKEAVFFTYGLMLLLGLSNTISSSFEQTYYTYSDVVLKVIHASAVVASRTWDDLSLLHKAMQEKVDAGQQDMSRLFRRARAPIFAVSGDGRIIAWNDHLVAVSGIAESEATGKPIQRFLHDESKETFSNAIESCWSSLSSSAVEIMISDSKATDGKGTPPVQISVTLIVQKGNDQGDTIMCVGQDLTETTRLKALHEETVRFTAVLGHELRSPLHGIIGLTSTLGEVAIDQSQKRQLGMVKGCAVRLFDIVTNIMEMAKADEVETSSGHNVCLSNVNMADLVDEVIGMTELAIDKSGKCLVADDVRLVNDMCEGELPVVKGDEYKITQLLYNLLTNAAKFTAKGTIRISAREVNNMLEVVVADTGDGIPGDALKQIFEPFQTHTQSFQGIGLGLSVAMIIARMHGGSIRVQSTVGQGSIFTVCLPCDITQRVCCSRLATWRGCERIRNTGQDESVMRAPDYSGREGNGSFKTATRCDGVQQKGERLPVILSVDDSRVNQEVVRRTLASEYRVVTAMDGLEALNYLDSGAEFPSIMLLDAIMPGMAGFEVAKEIRQARGITHAQLPVIMISARHPQEATAFDALNSGATDYMHKSFNGSVLKLRLQIISEVRSELLSTKAVVGCLRDKVTQTVGAVADSAARTPTLASAVLSSGAPALDTSAEKNSPSKVAEVAACWETINKLEKERDQMHTRLKSALQESTKAKQQLKSAEEELDRLKTEPAPGLGLAEPAPATGRLSSVEQPESLAHRTSSLAGSTELEIAKRTVEFYRAELQLNEREVDSLRAELYRHKSKAWLQRHRADCLEREFRFHCRFREPIADGGEVSSAKSGA